MKFLPYLAGSVLWTLLAITLCTGQQAGSLDVDAIKTGSTPYFTAKMENLTTKLELTPDQQAKLKPIAEHETNLLEQVRGNSGRSRKEKLAILQQVVHESDKQMKPWLSAQQWQKLQALRKDQKQQLKQYAKTK